MADLDFSNKQFVKQSQLGIPIGDKIVLGQLTSYKDGTAKWTYAKDTNPLIAGPGDRSTFTLFKDDKGKFNWTPTTSTSVSNLATREGFTAEQVTDSLYKTPQTQTVLNGGNVTQLGGINEAKKLGVPGTTGKATVTGPLPSTVSGNFAGQPGATQAAASTGDVTSAPVNLQDKIGSSGQSRTGAASFGTHRYPLDLDSSSQDKIKFDMLEYSPRGFEQDSKTNLGGFAERKSTGRTPLGTVFLPITSGISETNSCGWGEDRMDPGQALLANVALTSIQKGLTEGFGKAAEEFEKAAGAGNKDVKALAASFFAQQASGAGGILSRTQGAVINPNLELLFNGPALRPFSFTFKMSARSDTEAKEIIKIIRFFKQGMSPQKSPSNLFIKAPHTFKISYIRGKTDPHPFIGEIKECALQSFNVNYTPEGQYATFYDGPMISYEIQMQFTELEPVFNEDYGKSGSLPADLLFKKS